MVLNIDPFAGRCLVLVGRLFTAAIVTVTGVVWESVTTRHTAFLSGLMEIEQTAIEDGSVFDDGQVNLAMPFARFLCQNLQALEPTVRSMCQ